MDFKPILVTKDSCTLTWKKPISDGGSRIIAYILEVLNDDDDWKELMSSKNMQYSGKDLIEGREYKYRVKAMNDTGDGPEKELTLVAKDTIGEILYYYDLPSTHMHNTIDHSIFQVHNF